MVRRTLLQQKIAKNDKKHWELSEFEAQNNLWRWKMAKNYPKITRCSIVYVISWEMFFFLESTDRQLNRQTGRQTNSYPDVIWEVVFFWKQNLSAQLREVNCMESTFVRPFDFDGNCSSPRELNKEKFIETNFHFAWGMYKAMWQTVAPCSRINPAGVNSSRCEVEFAAVLKKCRDPLNRRTQDM